MLDTYVVPLKLKHASYFAVELCRVLFVSCVSVNSLFLHLAFIDTVSTRYLDRDVLGMLYGRRLWAGMLLNTYNGKVANLLGREDQVS